MPRLIFALLFLVLVFADTQVEDEDGVMILTDETFEDKIKELGTVLVKFYAPWCGHCKRLAPEYSAAAQELKAQNLPAYLGQVDCTVEKDLASKYEIKGFPTVKLFKNGNVADYEGGRTKDDIVKFMKKQTGPASTLLTEANVESVLENTHMKMILAVASESSEEYKAFLAAADAFEDIEFYHVVDADLAKKNGYSVPSATLISDHPVTFAGDLKSKDAIAQFIKENELPSVVIFSQEMARKIFSPKQEIHHQLILMGQQSVFDTHKEDFTKAAEAFKGKIIYLYIPQSESRLYDFFGVDSSAEYTLVAVLMGESMKKYKYNQESLSEEHLKAFSEEFLQNKLHPFLKSEPMPAEQSGPVFKLVGESFTEVALDATKNVFVKFYAPWCGHCKALAPHFEELAKKLKDHSDVVIADFDATANEVDHPDVNIRGYPTLKLFKAGDNTVVDFEGERTMEGMMEFLKKQIPSLEENSEEL